MPDIAKLLKVEISRLARKEIRTATEELELEIRTLKKNTKVQQAEILQLKRIVVKLERRPGAASTPVKNGSATDEPESKVRISSASIKNHRLRLKLSQQEFGRLLEVSTNTIVRWEAGTSKPRATHCQNIAKLRKSGQRQVRQLLAAL